MTARSYYGRYVLLFEHGGGRPVISDGSRLFSAPPSAEQLAELESRRRKERQVSREAAEAEKVARARARRADNLKALHEQMARNTALWHPACRPPGPEPTPPPGLEEARSRRLP